MIHVVLSGANGAMGRVLQQRIADTTDMQVVAGIDQNTGHIEAGDFPVYSSPQDLGLLSQKPDVIIDFSHHSLTDSLLACCVAEKIPAVIATTALSGTTLAKIQEASASIPLFRSANMSLGINLIARMMGVMVPPLEDSFNMEIIEKHHTKKVDSPSGTALLLADAINESCQTKKQYLYGRHGRADTCAITDLGIHAIRGGTIPGEHTILFAGDDEVIEITHRAMSKNIFATGAITAARFLANQKPGLYSMADVL